MFLIKNGVEICYTVGAAFIKNAKLAGYYAFLICRPHVGFMGSIV